MCKNQGAEFVIDTTDEPLRRALAYQPLLVKPNHHELAELFGVVIETQAQLITYGRRLLEEGARQVLISMIAAFCFLLTPSPEMERLSRRTCPCILFTVIGTVVDLADVLLPRLALFAVVRAVFDDGFDFILLPIVAVGYFKLLTDILDS